MGGGRLAFEGGHGGFGLGNSARRSERLRRLVYSSNLTNCPQLQRSVNLGGRHGGNR